MGDVPSGVVHIEHVALIVEDYDEAIGFFVDILGFELVEDTSATTNDGRPKRWVVVRPPGARSGLLLAKGHARTSGASMIAGYLGGSDKADLALCRFARRYADLRPGSADLRIFRRFVPSIGPLDISPMVGVIVLVIVQGLIHRVLDGV